MSGAAQVRSSHAYDAGSRATVRAVRHGMARGAGRFTGASSGYSTGGRLQCVPFARENTGIELSGNAATWWNAADGVYAKGARPEVGSILNFRANGRMRMGHVAVVSSVVDPRTIQIDHANWSGPGVGRGGISRNVQVVDVSDRNDWTAVRVSLGRSGDFGSVYPTYGFIYDRADTGTMLANNTHAPAPVLADAPRDLRPAAERVTFAEDVEVAEAPDEPRGRVSRRAGHRTVQAARVLSGKATVQRVSTRGAKPGHATPAKRRHRM